MVQYKLHYFDARWRAEPIRLLLTYEGQHFADVRYTFEEWPQKKPKFFYGTVPMLEVDGKQLHQSGAILRYLGAKYGLAGRDEWEKAKANEIIDFHSDAFKQLTPYLAVKEGIRKGDLEQLRTAEFEPGVEKFFPVFVRLLAQSGSGFLLASGISMVDFLVADFFNAVRLLEPQTIAKFPELMAYVRRFHSLPQLRKYLEQRKD